MNLVYDTHMKSVFALANVPEIASVWQCAILGLVLKCLLVNQPVHSGMSGVVARDDLDLKYPLGH